MIQSFEAAIGFARLVLIGAFLANLVVLVFTASQWHVSGVLLAIAAGAFAYWGQHQFTASAGYSLEHAEQGAAALGDLLARANAAEFRGMVCQVIGIACSVSSCVCFWAGMRP